MKIIQREDYLARLIGVMNTPDIKVITGVRRSGKSKLMDAFSRFLETNPETNNIIRISLNLKKYEHLLNKDELYRYVVSHEVEGKKNFVLIDEVQLCPEFETTINHLHEEERFSLFLTGSNAFMLSSDLATLFGGRVFEIHVLPFSFKEYLKYYPSEAIDASFDHYLRQGGMAGSYLYATQTDADHYLKNIVRATITKDIIRKYKIENENLLEMVVDFLMDNVGNKTSIRKIANTLTSNTYKTNDKTVGSYLDYLCKSFLFYPFTRYDIKGKKYLESDKKYFLADVSFRYAILGTKNTDYGHLYENLVALELLRRGYEVFVGEWQDKEIDFVAVKQGEKLYLQVSDDISQEMTLNREITPLLSISKDAYPKMLIARTKHPEYQIEGVRVVDIARWLSGNTD